MTILVLGATGATGRLLVEQLLSRGYSVRVIVRSLNRLPATIRSYANLSVIQATLLELSDAELLEQVRGCEAVASCLGHNLSFQGIFGQPRRLVTEATRRLCQAIRAANAEVPTKYVLMGSAGVQNHDLSEPISFAQRCVVGLIRLLIPPHKDNECAVDYLRTEVGQRDEAIEWVVVRPDSLIDSEVVTDYEPHASPTRSAIFNPGKTSRINVAHWMAQLIVDKHSWQTWKGCMPVIYNTETNSA